MTQPRCANAVQKRLYSGNNMVPRLILQTFLFFELSSGLATWCLYQQLRFVFDEVVLTALDVKRTT